MMSSGNWFNRPETVQLKLALGLIVFLSAVVALLAFLFGASDRWTVLSTVPIVAATALGLFATFAAAAIAAELFRLESDPVLVVDSVPSMPDGQMPAWLLLYQVSQSKFDFALKEIPFEPNWKVSDQHVRLAGDNRLLENVNLRIRNLGRSPAINVSLPIRFHFGTLAHRAARETINISAVSPLGGEAYVGIVNGTGSGFTLECVGLASDTSPNGGARQFSAYTPKPVHLPPS